MNIIEEHENKWRNNPYFGIQFGIDPECFECDIPEERLNFGKNDTWMNCGTTYNYQPVLFEGNEVAMLEEIQPYNIFEPMRISFIVGLDEDKLTRKEKKSKHFCMSPYDNPQMRFATMKQLCEYLKII